MQAIVELVMLITLPARRNELSLVQYEVLCHCGNFLSPALERSGGSTLPHSVSHAAISLETAEGFEDALHF